MPLPVFEQAYLLQSLGWAIANSFWQIGGLWILYQFVTNIDKKLPALVKHHFSVILLITSFVWFIFTILENYRLLSNAAASSQTFAVELLTLKLQPLSNILPFLSTIYLVALGLHSLRFFRSLSANRFLQTEGLTKAPIDFRLFTAKTALHLGIKKKVGVWLSENVDVPSVTGFIKPMILLPAAILNQLSIQQTEAILLHELAHIKRNDYLVNFLQSIIELVLFFNPFAILLSRAAKKERENCCDDWVMNFQYNSYEYANALLVLEEQRHFLQSRFALAATCGHKDLLQRVKRLFDTDPQTNFNSSQKLKFVVLCVLLLPGIITILPYVANKPAHNAAEVYNKKEKLNLVKFDRSLKENASKRVFAVLPVKPGKKKTQQVTTIKIKKQAAKPQEQSGIYVNAFVNEELLNPISQVEPIVSQVVEKEIENSKYLLKIEEQQSGKKQTNTYYFELNNKDGNAAIKPLMMLNKSKIPLKKTILGKSPCVSDTISVKVNVKKRVTS